MRLLFLALLASPAVAQPEFALPLDCDIGMTCFIEDYVDNAPEPGRQRDYACGINSRDKHKGTDFALLDFGAIGRGVAVRAAAPGTVLRVRDGMADDRLMRGVTSETACGNAVLLDHGDGFQTMYCHLRKDSVRVRPGTAVDTGTALGMVGLSGQTNHPHLHFQVMRAGAVIDPFRPDATGTCGAAEGSLWAIDPPYTKTGLITAGFSDRVPEFDAVRDGSARMADGTSDTPLVVYAHAGHAEHGDLLTLLATGPDGTEIFRRDSVLKAPQVSIMRAAGKKAPPEGWPPGDYLGEALLTRAGKVIAHRFAHVTVR
ncbi:M23 family metallopeptidase [Sagittula stellata]|uniref:Peptidase, M23/M37 family protein n=1 Tax=Sagittula stellata (strain ATCC 700073 / DSM 11524 / E-37) TaxID=388399 RepID=A3JXQ0_SAGS3|nr:M23 family metallopeptidase [Sagittula stellata]EBA10286.1 peptidase, M23/M37 family protein [Sagittula stellata E-37]